MTLGLGIHFWHLPDLTELALLSMTCTKKSSFDKSHLAETTVDAA